MKKCSSAFIAVRQRDSIALRITTIEALSKEYAFAFNNQSASLFKISTVIAKNLTINSSF